MKGAVAGALYYLAEHGGQEDCNPLWDTLSPSGREVYFYLLKHAEAEEELGFLLEQCNRFA